MRRWEELIIFNIYFFYTEERRLLHALDHLDEKMLSRIQDLASAVKFFLLLLLQIYPLLLSLSEVPRRIFGTKSMYVYIAIKKKLK